MNGPATHAARSAGVMSVGDAGVPGGRIGATDVTDVTDVTDAKGVDDVVGCNDGNGVDNVIVVHAPDGRCTRFLLDLDGAVPAWSTTDGVRDVRVLATVRSDAEAALARYAERDAVLPTPGRRAGRFAVIDASAADRIGLLRDGWAFRFGAGRTAGNGWLHACAGYVEAGYALHDALCLALARNTDAPVDASDPAPPLAAFPHVDAPQRIPFAAAPGGATAVPFDEEAVWVSGAAPTGIVEATSEAASKSASGAIPGAISPAAPPIDEGGRRAPPVFPRCAAPLGLYPIAPNADWVARLVDAGARTVQLRIKTAQAESTGRAAAAPEAAGDRALRDEIRRAVAYCREAPAPVQLFVNDHWRLAIEAGAYGVHLGQEDVAALPAAALDAIAGAGLRLGLSTHGYYEMLLALRTAPSYIACGPVFATQTKAVAARPQGLRRLAAYCRVVRDVTPAMPVVAIGGIGLAQLAAVRAAGASSAAVVGAVVNATTEMDRNALTRTVSALQAAFNG